MDAMYEAPSIEGEKEIRVTKENVEKGETPKIEGGKLLA
jgi:ATP-dependent protease Clp ATPase subunit